MHLNCLLAAERPPTLAMYIAYPSKAIALEKRPKGFFIGVWVGERLGLSGGQPSVCTLILSPCVPFDKFVSALPDKGGLRKREHLEKVMV